MGIFFGWRTSSFTSSCVEEKRKAEKRSRRNQKRHEYSSCHQSSSGVCQRCPKGFRRERDDNWSNLRSRSRYHVEGKTSLILVRIFPCPSLLLLIIFSSLRIRALFPFPLPPVDT